MLALGLAREADDERRAERGVGLLGANAVDGGRGSGRRSPIASCVAAAERRRAATRGRSRARPSAARAWWTRAGRGPRSGRGRGDGRGARPSGASVSSRRSSGASDPGSPTSRPYQARSCATSTSSATPLATRLAGLGLDRLGRAGALLAAERRDGAERAGAVAAFGDLQVRPRHARRGAGQLEQVAHADGLDHGHAERDRPPSPRARPRPRTRPPRRPRAARAASSSP